MARRGAGGTSGGIGRFLLGLAATAAGAYLFLSRVYVSSNLDTLFHGRAGLLLVPFGLGLALIFFSARSFLGWLLTIGSVAAIIVAVLANMTLFFMPTELLRTVAMIALLFVGLLMIVRSLRAS